MKASILITLIALSGLTTSPASLITTPVGNTSVEGNTNNVFPFDLGATTQRYQQVYAASEFAILAGGGEFITQLAFRPDNGSGGAFSSTLPGIRIDLSTVSVGPDALSATYAINVGGNDVVVYGGATGAPLTLSSSFTGPAGGPKDFDIIITLTTPFFYNPAAGNLLLDVRNFGGGSTTTFDVQASADSISRVFNSDVNLATGTADTIGLITRFTTTTIPEPATFSLLGLGALLLAARRRSA